MSTNDAFSTGVPIRHRHNSAPTVFRFLPRVGLLALAAYGEVPRKR